MLRPKAARNPRLCASGSNATLREPGFSSRFRKAGGGSACISRNDLHVDVRIVAATVEVRYQFVLVRAPQGCEHRRGVFTPRNLLENRDNEELASILCLAERVLGLGGKCSHGVQLRVNGPIEEVYKNPEDALDRVRDLMELDCDIEPEISILGLVGRLSLRLRSVGARNSPTKSASDRTAAQTSSGCANAPELKAQRGFRFPVMRQPGRDPLENFGEQDGR